MKCWLKRNAQNVWKFLFFAQLEARKAGEILPIFILTLGLLLRL
jgi:hypothetical protein